MDLGFDNPLFRLERLLFVFLFLHTDDFWRDYNHMKLAGVDFTEEPRVEEYGTVVVFTDLYGNKWDFIQPNAAKVGR